MFCMLCHELTNFCCHSRSLLFCWVLCLETNEKCLSFFLFPICLYPSCITLHPLIPICSCSQQKLIANLVKIQSDGTVEVDLDNSAPVASELLELRAIEGISSIHIDESYFEFNKSVPKLKIVMLVVGTRGDVQPFLAVAKRLQVCSIHQLLPKPKSLVLRP